MMVGSGAPFLRGRSWTVQFSGDFLIQSGQGFCDETGDVKSKNIYVGINAGLNDWTEKEFDVLLRELLGKIEHLEIIVTAFLCEAKCMTYNRYTTI